MNRLKELREKKGLTLKELSEALKKDDINISPDSLAKYERGERKPKYEKIISLAKFYDVSVQYLQGLEPDLYTIAPETKKTIISKLSAFYFDKDVNKSMRFIDPIERVKDAVNEYARLAELTPLPNELKRKSQKEKNDYLNKYFSFLFEDSMIIVMSNEYLYSQTNDVTKSYEDRFANRLAKSIENYSIQEFETKLGKYFGEIYNSKLQNAFKTFQRNISFCKSVEDISKQFDKFSDFLNTTKNGLNKAVLEKEITDIVSDLMRKDDNLGRSIAEIILNGQKLNKSYSRYDRIKMVNDYLVKNKKEVPKEISAYLEKYSNK